MRKALLFAPMLMLLLTACGGGEEKDPAAELQRQYAAVTSATMEADVTCHYEDEVREYTLLCAYAPESSTVTVLAPANLAGISATVSGEEVKLSYEDISLDAGSQSAAAISPVAALPKLMEAAASGYPTQVGEEDVGDRKCLRVACDLPDDEGTLYATWFDQETLLPLRSEISADSTVLYEVAWTRFEVTGRTEEPAAEVPETPAEPQTAPQSTVQTAPQAGTDAQGADSQTAPQQPQTGSGAAAQTPASVSDAQNIPMPANPEMTDGTAPSAEAAAYANAEE